MHDGSIDRMPQQRETGHGGRCFVVHANRLFEGTIIALRAIAGHIPSPTLPSRGESITRATFQCAIRAILR
jgi:hypothetical protein